MKRCPKCNETDPSQFHRNRRNPDGLATYCKACTSLNSAAAHAKRRAEYNKRRRMAYRTGKSLGEIGKPVKVLYTETKRTVAEIEAAIERICKRDAEAPKWTMPDAAYLGGAVIKGSRL